MKDIEEHLKAYAQRRTPKDESTGLPKRYVAGLTPAEKKEQVKEIKRVQKVYEETGQVVERKKVGGKSRRSPFVIRFEKRYGFPVTDIEKVKQEFPNTDIDTILSKGRGAFIFYRGVGKDSQNGGKRKLFIFDFPPDLYVT